MAYQKRKRAEIVAKQPVQLYSDAENPNMLVSQPKVSQAMFDRFVAYLDVAPKTVETYKGNIKQFFVYLQERGISSPTREDVIAFRDKVKETCKPTTVENYIIALRQFFNWTASEGFYPNIAEHIKGAKIDKEFKKDYFTSEQIRTILDGIDRNTVQGKRDYAMLLLMATCGLRDIEVNRANIEDLRALGDNTVLYVQGKGHEEKSIFVKVPKPVETAIRAYLMERQNKNPASPLFVSISNHGKDERLTTRSISRIAKNHFRAAGFDSDRLTSHSLRHSAITLALLSNKNFRLDEVQQFSRHASIDILQTYNHSLDRANNQCSEVVCNSILGED